MVSIYFKVWPVWIKIKFIGINPKTDATMKYLYGIPTKGEPKFTNQFGIRGVNLKNNMYQNKLCWFLLTIPLNFLNKAGNFLSTNCFASVELIKKHKEAPKQEH